MARSVPALVEPEVLAWARKSRGFTVEQAAKKLQLKQEAVEEWESGERKPTVAQLRKAAKVYRRPLSVFYLPEPPRDFDALRDFRQLPGEFLGAGPGLLAAIRRAYEIRNVALDLAKTLGDEVPEFSISATLDSDVSALALRVRSALKISVETQTRWKDLYTALRMWREALERLGVLVFQFPVPPLGPNKVDLSEARGFCIPAQQMPLIAVNASDALSGRVFTLFHELCHVLLRRSGVCDLADVTKLPPEQRNVEVFCNAFAAEFLLPKSDFKSRLSTKTKKRSWPESEIEDLSKTYCVSREVVVRRLLELNLTTQTFYRTKRTQYAVEVKKQRAAAKEKQEEFRIPYSRLVLRSLGPNYAASVLRAMHLGQITASSAAGYLGVKIKHLSRIEQSVFGRRAS